MTQTNDPARVGFTSINPKGDPSIHGSLPKQESFPNWKKVLRGMVGKSERRTRVVVMRKDLLNLLLTMETACPDSSGNSPIFLELGEEGGLLIRTINYITRQHVIGMVNVAREVKWLVRDKWEWSVFGYKVIRKGKREG